MTLGLLAALCMCVRMSVCMSLCLPSSVTNVSYAAAGSSINNSMMFTYQEGGVTRVLQMDERVDDVCVCFLLNLLACIV